MRAVTWNRISDKTEMKILENMVIANREYVKVKGWELLREYREVLTSKGITPGLERLLRDAEAHKFDVVVFGSLSRMTRGGTKFALAILERLGNAKVGWHFVENPVLNYDNTIPEWVKTIILTVFAELDKEYRARVSRGTRRKLAELKAQGKRLGGIAHHKPDCHCVVHRRIGMA